MYSTLTLEAIDGITWVNNIDKATPYQTGYDKKTWCVSIYFS